MTPVWVPATPLRFIERDGKKILQQCWVLQRYSRSANAWVNTETHDWRDVPLGEVPLSHWSQDGCLK
jgi:hypothetical protein